jgi:hypothetical protein
VQEESAKEASRKRATRNHLFDPFIVTLPVFELMLFYDVG